MYVVGLTIFGFVLSRYLVQEIKVAFFNRDRKLSFAGFHCCMEHLQSPFFLPIYVEEGRFKNNEDWNRERIVHFRKEIMCCNTECFLSE